MVDEELSLQHDRELIEGGGLEGLECVMNYACMIAQCVINFAPYQVDFTFFFAITT